MENIIFSAAFALSAREEAISFQGKVSDAVDEVPEGDPHRAEIVQLFNEVLPRVK